MSLFDKIKLDEAFMNHYTEGSFDVCDTRSHTSKVYETGEVVLTSYYPVIYALRKLNYYDNLTQDEIQLINKKARKIIDKGELTKRINELQQRVDNLQKEIDELN